MSHAIAYGTSVPLPERSLRRCDDCGAWSWVPSDDADALWVVCGDCATLGRASTRIQVALRVGATWAKADRGERDPWALTGRRP